MSDVVVELHDDDLVDDRALTIETQDEDAFGLREIVEEVAQLCVSVLTPATVAVYGSWGSGKSSLANLLASRLDVSHVAFARFDAFKYAETPLRRHFLSQIAPQLGENDKKFSEGLYETTKQVTLRAAREDEGVASRVALVLGGALAFALALAALLSLLVALASTHSKGSFWLHLGTALRTSIPGILLASPFIAALAALVTRLFTADTTAEAPSSDEQFEKLFGDLVQKVVKRRKCDRIVVFIDELDRCSPRQVVSALETLRTFLEVSPCVFIVAADQQALEHALEDAARQATPINTTNPYYSAGSAYLDKIFQYQLALPPILPRRLSRFALDLIKDRQGIWALANRGLVISVLVPPHIRSPRRVKALLNAFALQFRLAVTRAQARSVDADVINRAAEMAKLVCLRTEFPLFANDLQLSDRLPEIVLWLHDAGDEGEDEEALRGAFPNASDEALARAQLYAKGKAPVELVISRQQQRGVAGESDEDRSDDRVRVEQSQIQQLISYLQFTRQIPNPKRDLIHLEGSGSAFDLAAEIAERLENAAIANRRDEVADFLPSLNEEDQQRALRLFAWLLRETVGIEVANVAAALFGALSETTADLAPIADDVLNGLVTRQKDYDLAAEDLVGAFKLSMAGESDAAQEMREIVLAREEALTSSQLALLILGSAEQLKEARERLSEILSRRVSLGWGEDAEDALADVSEELVLDMVDALRIDEEDMEEGVASLGAFLEAAKRRGRDAVARRALGHLLALDVHAAGGVVARVIPSFAPITGDELAAAVIRRARVRPVQEWPVWLGALDDSVRREQEGGGEITEYLCRLWQARFAPEDGEESPSGAEFAAAAEEIALLRSGEPAGDVDLLEDEPAITQQAEIDHRETQFATVWQLVEAEALGELAAGGSILRDLGRTLVASQPQSHPTELGNYVLVEAPRALATADEGAVRAFATAVDQSSWLPELVGHVLEVRAACALRRVGVDDPAPGASLEALVAADVSVAVNAALAEWVTTFGPEPSAFCKLFAPQLEAGRHLREPLFGAVKGLATTWAKEAKADTLERLADDFLSGKLHKSFVSGMDLAAADEKRAANLLIDRYQRASNNDERRIVVELWNLLRPEGVPLRRLIDKIYIPLLGQGKGAVGIALKHFDLVLQSTEKAVRDRAKRAILEAVKGDKDLSKKAKALFEEAGWAPPEPPAKKKKKKKFGIF